MTARSPTLDHHLHSAVPGGSGGAGSVLVQAVLSRGGSASEAEGALAGAFRRAPAGPEAPAPAVIVLGVLLAEAGNFAAAQRVLADLLERGGGSGQPGGAGGSLSQVDLEVAARLLVVDVLCEGLEAPRDAGAWVAAQARVLGPRLAGELAGTVARFTAASPAPTGKEGRAAAAEGDGGAGSGPASPHPRRPSAAELPDPPSTPARAVEPPAETAAAGALAEFDWATAAAVGAVGAALAWALYSERRTLWRATRRLLPW